MEEEENFSLDNCPLYNDGYVAQLLRPSLNEDSAGFDMWLNKEPLSSSPSQAKSSRLEQEKEIFYLKTIMALQTEFEGLKKHNDYLVERNTWLEKSEENCKIIFFEMLAGNIQTEAMLNNGNNDKSINESVPESIGRENLPNTIILKTKNDSEASVVARKLLEESAKRKRELIDLPPNQLEMESNQLLQRTYVNIFKNKYLSQQPKIKKSKIQKSNT